MALDNAYPSSATQLSTMTQWEAFFVAGFGGSTGVVPGVGAQFSASLNTTGRTIDLAAGAAMIRGFYVNGSSTVSTSIPNADTQNRIDRLVLRLDRSSGTAGGWITPVVVTGTPAATPQLPALLVSPTGYWDLPVCHWTSASNGSLSGLVDDRYYLGSPTMRFNSGSRPPAAPGLGIESDTGRIMQADGTAWSVFFSDSGWKTWPYPSGWKTAGSNPGYKLVTLGTDSYLKFAGHLQKTSGASFSLSSGVVIGTLPTGFRPSVTRYMPLATQYTTDASARIGVDTDGTVTVQGPQSIAWLSLDGITVPM